MSRQQATAGIPADVDTVMLDMDGTILDLAYDNFIWLEQVPAAYAAHHELPEDAARKILFDWFGSKRGTLDWYCLDHWSERLGLDVVALHREHRERIVYLPGARELLEVVAASELRVLLTTNSHPSTLTLKDEVTGLSRYFDGIYHAHALGYPKEQQAYWHALSEEVEFDPDRALFIDDTASVLRGALEYGIGHLLQIRRPDSRNAPREDLRFESIDSLGDLIGASV